MKLIVPLSVVESMLREKYNLPDATEIQISDLHLSKLLRAIREKICGLRYNSDQKILAVKTLREVWANNSEIGHHGRTLSLTASKNAVENLDYIIRWMERTGKEPFTPYGELDSEVIKFNK